MMFREGQAHSPTKSEWDSAENLIDGADGEQSLSLDGRKVCNIKRVGISQAESNKATVYALPSIHLPLTREASAIVLFEGLCGKGGHGGMLWVLLKHYCFTTGHHFDDC